MLGMFLENICGNVGRKDPVRKAPLTQELFLCIASLTVMEVADVSSGLSPLGCPSLPAETPESGCRRCSCGTHHTSQGQGTAHACVGGSKTTRADDRFRRVGKEGWKERERAGKREFSAVGGRLSLE